jgi:hypothetical protein
MKRYFRAVLWMVSLLLVFSCEKESMSIENIDDVGLRVSFNSNKSASVLKNTDEFTYETPQNYFVALKSVKLLGAEGSSDVELFNEPDLGSSFVFDFTDKNVVHSLLSGTKIPDGKYSSIEVEIYYLQMNLSISTTERGKERRNIRIYLSDDVETEQGLHQPGDMTQINDGHEIGWLLGEGQSPNMDPASPRTAAYTENGDAVTWYDFAGKSGKDYGPFGDIQFYNTATHPIYRTTVSFNFENKNGTNLILNFNVQDCWQFEDKDGDGSFGAGDLDPVDPTEWHMALPEMTVTLE